MNKAIAIMQPYLLPYIGYWQLLSHVDTYVIYDDVNYRKQSWVNRNRILANGKPAYFNIRLEQASSNKTFQQITILCDPVHIKKLMRTLQQCYGKAPFFNRSFPVLEEIFLQEETCLSKYLEFSIRRICAYLHIETEILLSSELAKNSGLKAQEKVLDICGLLGASEYCNAVGGAELYSKEEFESHGIQLYFLKTRDIRYRQFSDEFVPYLSIIDFMMFNDPENIRGMLKEFDLL